MNNRILPAFALILAIGIFFAYVSPAWSGSIAATKAAIAADDEALVSAQQYSTQQNQLASARDAIDPVNLAALSTFLPDSVDNVGLILDLNALAARSGFSVANIDVVTGGTGAPRPRSGGALPSAVDPVGSVDLSLTAVGTFSSLQSFLSGVEKSARIIDIRDLIIKGSDTGVYDYQMTLSLYWLR
jgi:Tfp pilus assembly protein PilO